MNKLLQIGMCAAILGTGTIGFAAEKWGSAELATATASALANFKASVADADLNIKEVNLKKGVQGTSAQVKVSYKVVEGDTTVIKTAEYFCHVHQHEGEEAEIDCH